MRKRRMGVDCYRRRSPVARVESVQFRDECVGMSFGGGLDEEEEEEKRV